MTQYAQLSIFNRQLASMLRQNIPLSEAIGIAAANCSEDTFRNLLSDLSEKTEKGASLSEAVENNSDRFPPFYLSMLKSAEKGGNLEKVLTALSAYYASCEHLKKSIMKLCIYPSVILILFFSIIPVVGNTLSETAELSKSLEINMSTATMLLRRFSLFVIDYCPLLIGAVALFILNIYHKIPGVSKIVNICTEKIPMISDVPRYRFAILFSKALIVMLENGMQLPEAVKIIADFSPEGREKAMLNRVHQRLLLGDSFSDTVADENLLPDVFPAFVRIGEKNGDVYPVLTDLSEFCEGEIHYLEKTLPEYTEIFLILFMGIFVGFFIIGIFTPMISLVNGAM